MKPVVLLLGQVLYAQKEWDALSEIATPKVCESKNREDFIKDCKGKYSDVKVISRTFASASITGPFDEELAKAVPSSLRFICHNGAGYDQISVGAFTERDIRVSNTPKAVDNATADTNMFLILGALRNYAYALMQLRRGEFRNGVEIAHDPEQKTLGILGMGGIGRALARRAESFDMKIIYHNRSQLPGDLEGGATYVSFDQLLAQSDVISINVPLNNNTRHMISTDEFKKMKKGVVVTNTARGAVIDEAALVKALDDGIVFSAGLDVYEEEPKIHPGLLKNEKVLLLPHMGTLTLETQYDMECLVIRNVESAVKHDKLLTPVPEQHHLQKPLL